MCMCGDPYCPSCGSAQGNNRCPYCGAWSADGGCADPAKCKQADDQYCDAMIAEAKWEAEHKDEIEAARRDECAGCGYPQDQCGCCWE